MSDAPDRGKVLPFPMRTGNISPEQRKAYEIAHRQICELPAVKALLDDIVMRLWNLEIRPGNVWTLDDLLVEALWKARNAMKTHLEAIGWLKPGDGDT
jgi:hypothetical protein